MKNRIFSLIALFLFVTVSFAQGELNGYKYIIVPKKYNFLKGEEDRYRLNSLTKYLFTKNGFNTIFQDDSFPEDLLANPCLGVIVDINDGSKMFSTKLMFELSDCYNKIVFTSIEGASREKLYEKAYQEALRGAFVSFEAMNYEFNPSEVTNISQTSKLNNTNNVTVVKTQEEPTIVESEPKISVAAETKVNEEPNLVDSVENDEIEKDVVEESVVEEEPAKVESNQAQPVSQTKATPVVVPVVATTGKKDEINDSTSNSILKSYKNENISFFIVEQDQKLVAYVNETKDGTYKKGEMIGTFIKTSIPNVYRVTWRNKEGENVETTGYFDDEGNLKVDVNRNGNIEVIIFEVEK